MPPVPESAGGDHAYARVAGGEEVMHLPQAESQKSREPQKSTLPAKMSISACLRAENEQVRG